MCFQKRLVITVLVVSPFEVWVAVLSPEKKKQRSRPPRRPGGGHAAWAANVHRTVAARLPTGVELNSDQKLRSKQ